MSLTLSQKKILVIMIVAFLAIIGSLSVYKAVAGTFRVPSKNDGVASLRQNSEIKGMPGSALSTANTGEENDAVKIKEREREKESESEEEEEGGGNAVAEGGEEDEGKGENDTEEASSAELCPLGQDCKDESCKLAHPKDPESASDS